MLQITDKKLSNRSELFRYMFFLISGCRLVRYQTWKQAGEPNPFVTRTYDRPTTDRVEFVDIFGDELSKPPQAGS